MTISSVRPRLTPAVAAVLVTAAYLCLACLAFGSTGPFDGSRLPNGFVGDPLQMTWFLAWTPHAILHGHDPFFTTAIDYPTGASLASNTSVPLLGVIGAPITYLLNPIATFNVLLRLALATSAMSMYWLLGRWCGSRAARFVGGLIFGFSPYAATHIANEGHLNLVFLPLVPLLAWCFDAAFCDDRRRPVRVGIALGVLGAAQLLISPEVLSDSAIVGAVVLVVLALIHRDVARERARRATIVVASAAAAFAALAAWPITEMLAGRRHLSGPVASVTHLQSFRIDLLAPFLPTDRQLFSPGPLVNAASAAAAPALRAGGGSEVGAYLGIPLAIAVVVTVVLCRRSAVVRAFGIATAVAFVLALGGRLQIDGRITPIRLPELALAHLPLLRDTVPARFLALVCFGAAAVVAVGLDRAVGAARSIDDSRRRTAGIGAVAIAALLVVLPLVPNRAFSSESTAESPSVAEAIATRVPVGSVALTYPYVDPPFTQAMAWQAVDRNAFTLIGGYATVPTPSGGAAAFAPLLDPPGIQEFLARAQAGRARHYPAAATPSVADLCTFVGRYGVGSVIYSPEPASAAVHSLFTDAFGTGRTVGGIEFWDSANQGVCRLKNVALHR